MIYNRLMILGFLFVLLTSCQNKELKIAMGSIESDPQNFYQLPKEFQAKPEIALLALEKSAKIFKDLDIFLKEDEAFVLEAVDKNFRVYAELSNRLKKNTDILGLYQKKKIENHKKYGIEMVFIKGGSFMMGSEEDDWEMPVHGVEVRDFYISKTEVTIGQYLKCVEAQVCSKPHWDDGSCWVVNESDKRVQGVLGKDFRGENQPAVCVDWNQARMFAKWVGGDLPSEEQWEYAARSGGGDIKYPWGNTEATCEYAVMDDEGDGCGYHRTWDVCSKTEGNTVQGLCDMGGNVWEWVLNEWHASYDGAPINDIGWCSDTKCESNTSARRVLRGGSWRYNASFLRSARRFNNTPTCRRDNLGFRIADIIY